MIRRGSVGARARLTSVAAGLMLVGVFAAADAGTASVDRLAAANASAARLGPAPVPCHPAPCGQPGQPALPAGQLEQSTLIHLAITPHVVRPGDVVTMVITYSGSGHCREEDGSTCGPQGTPEISMVRVDCRTHTEIPVPTFAQADATTQCFKATPSTAVGAPFYATITAPVGNCGSTNGVSDCISADYLLIEPPSKAPILTLSARPVKRSAAGGDVELTATVTTVSKITGAALNVALAPTELLTSVFGAGTKRLGMVPANSTRREQVRARVRPLFGAAGATVAELNALDGGRGWQTAPPPPADLTGGELVYSDSPEYILGAATRGKPTKDKNGKVIPGKFTPATTIANGRVGGPDVEGILYAQRTTSAAGDFRVYLNHENRTDVSKSICVVITPVGPGPVILTQQSIGVAVHPGDPVAAGAEALKAYESNRRSARPTTSTLGKGGAPAYVNCVADIVQAKYAGVVNAIIDYHADGGVRVGVVAVNTAREDLFRGAPLTYAFADGLNPKGDPVRTYLSDGPLRNPGETHVAGTYQHNTVQIKLPEVKMDKAKPIGVLVAGNPLKMRKQYERALDGTRLTNKGNYGVFYEVTIPTTGRPGETAEVVLNPRAVGFDKALGVTNAFAGIADVPSLLQGSLGAEIPVPATDKIKINDRGTVLGFVDAGKSFTFDFMPPGGASAPDAIVVIPAFVKAKASLAYSGGSTSATPHPLIVSLR
jgi:hypothetical protein